MPTQKQIDANRRNARKSIGPTSPEGKAVARFNALKTGITARSLVIPGEDPEELEALTADYHEQFQPAGAHERFLVDALIYADWQLRRLRRVEAQLWSNEIASAKNSIHGLSKDAPLGQVFDRSLDAFTRLQRRIDSIERSYYRALTQLQRLHAGAKPPSPLPQPLEESATSPELASFFHVPPSPLERPPAAPDPHPPPLPPAA